MLTSVRDNRIGIPPKKKDRLKPTGEGTGLGLSISYEIVTQQHGGTITVDSELGDCAEFTLRLLRRSLLGHGGTLATVRPADLWVHGLDRADAFGDGEQPEQAGHDQCDADRRRAEIL